MEASTTAESRRKWQMERSSITFWIRKSLIPSTSSFPTIPTILSTLQTSGHSLSRLVHSLNLICLNRKSLTKVTYYYSQGNMISELLVREILISELLVREILISELLVMEILISKLLARETLISELLVKELTRTTVSGWYQKWQSRFHRGKQYRYGKLWKIATLVR